MTHEEILHEIFQFEKEMDVEEQRFQPMSRQDINAKRIVFYARMYANYQQAIRELKLFDIPKMPRMSPGIYPADGSVYKIPESKNDEVQQ